MAPQVLAGKYKLEEEIARGGMGVIYRAVDLKLQGTVAIKLVHAHLGSDPSFAERFLREARAMAKLRQHENIVKIYAVEEEHNTQFLVMEFCPGRNLRTVIKKQAPLPLRDVVHLAEQIASALAYAHAQGVIHRDIKPANVLVDDRGKAKLTDFGIAGALDEAGLTRPQEVIGTPEYMSPEQARGLKLDQLNGRSDLYSLGIVLYEMLTGQTPYPESSATAILGKLAYDREELSLVFPGYVPPLVQGIVRDLVRRDPNERISDAETLANQLHEILYILPQATMMGASDESDATRIVPSRQDHSGDYTRPISQMGDPLLSPPPLNRPSDPVSPRGNQPVPFYEDRTRPIPTPDRARAQVNRPEPIISTHPEIAAPPPARPLGVIVAAGIVLIGLTAIGLISYFPSQPQKIASGDESIEIPTRQIEAETQPPAPLPNPPEEGKAATPQPILPPQQARPPEKIDSVMTAVQGATTFPDAALQSLLDRFQEAYERQDLPELRALSRMDESRQRYVQEMFHTYKTLNLSRPNLTQEDNGATAVFLIDRAVTTTGETVDLTPIARKITLHIPRQADAWGKIVW